MNTTPVTLWGSSHLTNYHFFPEYFSKHLCREKTLYIRQIYARGGQKMTHWVVEDIKRDVEETTETKQIVILVLSGNNLRNKTTWTPENVIQLYQEVTTHIQQHTQKEVYLVYAGIIPCPNMSIGTQQRFSDFDKMLKDHCYQSNISFFDSANVFRYNNTIESSFFENDMIHMNQSGVDWYTTCLVNHLKNFVN